jgi:hypothetical protein
MRKEQGELIFDDGRESYEKNFNTSNPDERRIDPNPTIVERSQQSARMARLEAVGSRARSWL